MARTPDPSTLRLAAIDPDALGRDLAAAVAHYTSRLAVPLSPGYEIHVGECHGDTTVGLTAADLARYARDGAPLDSTVEDYAVELVALLASPLDDPGAIPATLTRWLSGDVDVRDFRADSIADRLALVITAALGRERIETGRAVTAAQLAVLGGVDPKSTRRLIQAGEIKARDGRVKATEARRWLSGRGVRV